MGFPHRFYKSQIQDFMKGGAFSGGTQGKSDNKKLGWKKTGPQKTGHTKLQSSGKTKLF